MQKKIERARERKKWTKNKIEKNENLFFMHLTRFNERVRERER